MVGSVSFGKACVAGKVPKSTRTVEGAVAAEAEDDHLGGRVAATQQLNQRRPVCVSWRSARAAWYNRWVGERGHVNCCPPLSSSDPGVHGMTPHYFIPLPHLGPPPERSWTASRPSFWTAAKTAAPSCPPLSRLTKPTTRGLGRGCCDMFALRLRGGRRGGAASVARSTARASSAGAMSQLTVYTAEVVRTATGGFGAANKLAEGGSCEVFHGTLNDNSRTRVAVKRYRDGHQLDVAKDLEAFAKLPAHPNLLRPLGLVSGRCLVTVTWISALTLTFTAQVADGRNVHVVYPLMEETLTRRLGPSELSLTERLVVALDVARGLSALHAVSLTHRDVKPDNVLLRPGGGALLCDYGLLRELTGTHTHTQNVSGTPGYRAPEYLDGGIISAPMDVYSFGVVLLQLLTGDQHAPWLMERSRGFRDGTAPVATITQLVWPPGQLEGLGVLARQCLGSQPQNRPTAADVSAALEAIVRGSSPAASADAAPAPAAPAAADPRMCIICDDHPRGVRFTACGHWVVCEDCALQIVHHAEEQRRPPTCPTCRCHLGGADPMWVMCDDDLTYDPVAAAPVAAAPIQPAGQLSAVDQEALGELARGATEISASGLTPQGVLAFSHALERNTTLTSLNLNGNNIGDGDGLRALAGALERNTALTRLNLLRNNIGYAGKAALARAWAGRTYHLWIS